MPGDTLRAVDRAALERVQRRLASAEPPPWLHGEVARRMAERLPVFRLVPTVLIDWCAQAGASGALLRQAYPHARRLRVEPVAASAEAPAPWWRALRRRDAPALAPAAVPQDTAQLVWANMVLHAVADPGATIEAWRRALQVEGVLMFSTLGPDTLKTLREIYRDAGWGPAHAPFVDMHDLGDMLVAQGFADPVMDQERLQLSWPTPQAALDELRGLGGNADPARFAGLRTPRWRARLHAALAQHAAGDGRPTLEFEIVYGHAFKALPRVRLQGEARLTPADLQRMARTGRRDGTLG